MSRFIVLALLFSLGMWAQEQKTQQPPKVQQQEPPEEDESLAPKEYTFNPLQASKEVNIGNYYFKQKKYRAAAKRFTEATRWNPGSAEAYLRLGEAEDKLRDATAAQLAYAKYIELAPDAKNVDSIRKKLAHRK